METNLGAPIIGQMRAGDGLDWERYRKEGEVDIYEVYFGD